MSHVIYCILYWKWKAGWLYEHWMVVGVSVVYPCDWAADWAAAQESVVPHTTSLGKGLKFEILSIVSTECVLFLHHHKVEKILSQGWSILISWGFTTLSPPAIVNTTISTHGYSRKEWPWPNEYIVHESKKSRHMRWDFKITMCVLSYTRVWNKHHKHHLKGRNRRKEMEA